MSTAITMATRMHLPLNLTWKWTLTDFSFSSSESFRSSYYSSRQYNDNTHMQTNVTHKASRLSLTASFITAVSEEWMLPPEGWGRPSGWATGASEMSRVGEKKWMLPAFSDMLQVSYIQGRTASTWSGQDGGINLCKKDLGFGDMWTKIHNKVSKYMKIMDEVEAKNP